MQRREFLGVSAGLALSPSGVGSVEARDTFASKSIPWPEIAGVLRDDELGYGICLLDIRNSTTEISVYLNHACLARNTLSCGGNAITGTVGQSLGLDFQTAQALIHSSGHAFACMVDAREAISTTGCSLPSPLRAYPSRRDLANLMQAEIEKLFMQVRAFLRENNHEPDLCCGVVVHGRAASIPGIIELGEEVFHALVRTVPALQP